LLLLSGELAAAQLLGLPVRYDDFWKGGAYTEVWVWVEGGVGGEK
jgi:hypothetical protein